LGNWSFYSAFLVAKSLMGSLDAVPLAERIRKGYANARLALPCSMLTKILVQKNKR